MQIKFRCRIVISSLTANGHIRMYFREFTDISSAEECVNKFLLNTKTRWIRILEMNNPMLWQEVAFLDCRVNNGKFNWPL